ncbi:MAG: hypothetical protein ACNS60_08785 [Candidatus Cyclobacteriaceae bacterium M2_1C_046]
MGKLFKILVVSLALIMVSTVSWAQCAMCRATLENNLSNGEIGPGANINLGIMYLFIFPYLLIAVGAYFWYRNSKASQAAS